MKAARHANIRNISKWNVTVILHEYKLTQLGHQNRYIHVKVYIGLFHVSGRQYLQKLLMLTVSKKAFPSIAMPVERVSSEFEALQ